MFQPFYVAATGLNTFEDEMVDVTNNLANAKTVGFKKGTTEKESMFYVEKNFDTKLNEALKKQEAAGPNAGVEYGTGVRVVATPKDFSQGTIEITNNPLDVAVSGDGFFQLRMADGTTAYSRSGNFHLDNEGNIVDPNGRMLEPPITIPSGTSSILINPSGQVSVSINNSTTLTSIGQINLAKFPNQAGLQSLGQNLYTQTDSSGEAIVGLPTQEGYGQLQQAAVEQSNVDVVSEMMRMLMVQRVFDTVTKAVASYDAMMTSVERMKS
jgi:flagellar basal-body rod protein FlgG